MTIDLNAIKARVEAATEGPWEAVPDPDTRSVSVPTRCDGIFGPKREGEEDWERRSIVVTDSGYYPPGMPDAEFIAHARQDIPALLQEIERLTAERDGWLATAARHKHSLATLQAQHDTLRGERDGLLDLIQRMRDAGSRDGLAIYWKEVYALFPEPRSLPAAHPLEAK